MLSFKYTIAAVNLIFIFVMIILAALPRKEEKGVPLTCLVVAILPLVNMIAILT